MMEEVEGGGRFVRSGVDVHFSPHFLFDDKDICMHECYDQRFVASGQGFIYQCVFWYSAYSLPNFSYSLGSS